MKEQTHSFGMTIPMLEVLVKDVEDEQPSLAFQEITLAMFYLWRADDNLGATYMIYLMVVYAGMTKSDGLSICYNSLDQS